MRRAIVDPLLAGRGLERLDGEAERARAACSHDDTPGSASVGFDGRDLTQLRFQLLSRRPADGGLGAGSAKGVWTMGDDDAIRR